MHMHREPQTMQMAPMEGDVLPQVRHLLERIAARGVSILLVEQRVAEALESRDRGYVLETGRVVMEGRHDDLIADARVKRAYLGM